MGFLPKLSEIGPKNKGPIPSPRKIIVISNWLSTTFAVPIEIPIKLRAGSKASIDNATIDIKEAIKAINSNCAYVVFDIRQKYTKWTLNNIFFLLIKAMAS